MDGSLVVYDKEKDDAAFLPEESNGVHTNGNSDSDGSVDVSARLHIDKSVHSKNQRFNPVSAWKLSNQRINAFAFSPDNRHIAVVSEDGTLRIIDYLKEQWVTQYDFSSAQLTGLDSWISMQVTTAVFSVSAGHPMASTSLQVVKMISFPSGRSLNLSSLRAAKAINLGSRLYALIHGAVMTATIDLDP